MPPRTLAPQKTTPPVPVVSATAILVEDSEFAGTDSELITIIRSYHKKIKKQCHAEGCTVSSIWCGRPTVLIVLRKNHNPTDLRISNLTFMCPNCYTSQFNQPVRPPRQRKQVLCELCGYDITTFSKAIRDTKQCKICSTKRIDNLDNTLTIDYEMSLTALCHSGTVSSTAPSWVIPGDTVDDDIPLKSKQHYHTATRNSSGKSTTAATLQIPINDIDSNITVSSILHNIHYEDAAEDDFAPPASSDVDAGGDSAPPCPPTDADIEYSTFYPSDDER
jgi:hypothetical protein